MNAYTLRGNVQMMSGKILKGFGNYTGNNRLYFSGFRREVIGKMMRSYGRALDMIRKFRMRS